jgi:tetratricopeptide (TPR) repeat protein
MVMVVMFVMQERRMKQRTQRGERAERTEHKVLRGLVSMAPMILMCLLILIVMLGAMTSDGREGTSLLGRPLVPPAPADDVARDLNENLTRAHADWQAAPDDEQAIIWYGRRLAYLGRYREAIGIYSTGLRLFPDSHRLRRHRGHRYLTVRQISNANDDLTRAARMIEQRPDEIEPDGAPNARGIPTSTDHTNIWYHLGLAQYISGDFRSAYDSFTHCASRSTNDDMHVAAAYWRFLSHARMGELDAAREEITFVTPHLEIIENDAYFRLLLLYSGQSSREEIATPVDGVQNATLHYGLAMWDMLNGRSAEAYEQFERIVAGPAWAAFGSLAAEAELARRF